jgi:hypothetical protein
LPIPAELFLSHSGLDRAFVDALGQVLDRHGVPYWYSRKSVQGAKQWHDEIGSALDRCDWFLVVLSPAAVASEWVKRELLFALEELRYNGRIVPILHQPCEHKKLSWVLRSLQFVDFSGQPFEAGCRDLLRIWGLGFIPEPR